MAYLLSFVLTFFVTAFNNVVLGVGEYRSAIWTFFRFRLAFGNDRLAPQRKFTFGVLTAAVEEAAA